MSVEGSRIRLLALVACLLAALLVGAQSASDEISCLDEEGNSVDWYIGYKFPMIDGTNQLFRDGLAYAYITSENATKESEELPYEHQPEPDSMIFLFRFKELLLRYLGLRSPNAHPPKRDSVRTKNSSAKWSASKRAISDPESVILRTLAPAFIGRNPNLNSIFYNDDPGNSGSSSMSRAHAKGVLLMDEESGNGVWLTHSVPRFPDVLDAQLEYPKSGTKNGQTFMCITFDIYKSGKQIVDHLVNMRPQVYENQISDWMRATIPDLYNLDLAANMRYRRVGMQPKLAQMITTKGGQILQLFAKSNSYDADIYDGWIDEEIGSDLFVETWRNGQGNPLDSNCPKDDYHINNVENLKYDDRLQWSYRKDHSKWAISNEKDVATVCIGDLNRMSSQFKRGGGAVCIKCPTCWDVFSSTIQDVESCPIRSQKHRNTSRVASISLLNRIKKSLSL